MIAKKKLNLGNIPGIQEITDSAAESLNGGRGSNLANLLANQTINFELATSRSRIERDKAESILF